MNEMAENSSSDTAPNINRESNTCPFSPPKSDNSYLGEVI
jgi:hypothetical protein